MALKTRKTRITKTKVSSLPLDGRVKKRSKYHGLYQRLEGLMVGDAIWVYCPPDVTFEKHRSTMQSFMANAKERYGIQLMSRSDRAKNRFAIGRLG